MKSIKKLFFLILLFISLTVSCQREESLDIRNTEYISFKFSDEALSASGIVTKGTCDTLSYEIGDWDYIGEESDSDVQTKGSLSEYLSGKVGMFAQWSGSSALEMDNALHTVSSRELVPETKLLWKNYTSGTIKFLSYAPYNEDIKAGTDASGRYFSYTVAGTISEQKDLLLATASHECSMNKRNAIPLAYRHGLTAIQFRMGFDCNVKNITISNVKNNGKFYLDGTTPSVYSGNATYSLKYDGAGKHVQRDSIVNKGNEMLILMPQSFDSDAQTISLTYNDGSEDHTITAKLNGTDAWPAGTKVIYTLKKTGDADEYIYLDIGLGYVNLTAAGYSGYVSVNGTITKVEGAHHDNNRYYIYQSIYDQGQTPNWDHNVDDVRYTVTGYASAADFEAKKNCRVPQYKSDIMFFTPDKKGKTCPDWGKFITNNQSPHTVRYTWDNGDQNYSTTNVINICGPETGLSVFDVTIDRVFSRIGAYNKGSLNIGHNGSGFKYYYTEKVILRLKNNNALNRIHYRKPLSCTTDGCLKITSADGDGIAKGTLTVTESKMSETAGPTYKYVYSLIGPGRDDDGKDYEDEKGKEGRQMKDLYFDGGIVYVGTQKYLSSKWKNNNPLLGVIGGVNSWAEITVNGGILTAVSNNTSPAIGGGGGWESTGGKGVVTINGGTVYAYSFGVLGTYDGQETVVIPPAIGGGSTLGAYVKEGVYYASNAGPCQVEIKGGNVYAYAVGGPAIGGGSAGRHTAGSCTLTIRGGNVVAKSLSGTIGDRAVSATNAIGGGRSGLVDGDGGTATVTVSGGYLHTGSVGGGSVDERNTTGRLGSAIINIDGGETSAQFIMAKGAGVPPSFKMTGGSIWNNNTSDSEYANVRRNGGAVYMEDGSCTISGGIIEKCSADTAGAVYMSGGKFEMTGGTISNCTAKTHGGAIYIDGGDVTIKGGSIEKNLASLGNGGGVYVSAGDFRMPAGSIGKINNNSANADPDSFEYGNGGGIYVRSTTKDVNVDIISGEVQYNASDINGGGLCVDMLGSSHTATITIGKSGGTAASPNIASNSASMSGGGMAVEGSGSNIIIKSGTVKGNVSAYVKNEDIRNDGGMVDLQGKGAEVDVNYKTITFYANNGYDPEPYAEQRVVTSTNSPLNPPAAARAFEKEFYHKASWNTRRDGSGVHYNIDGTGENMNITDDLSLYAQWEENK